MSLFLLLYLDTVAPLLLAVAFFTLAERKIIASIQRRKGPNRTFFFGLLQPIADGLKAVLKELIFPSRIDFFFFLLSPWLTFFISLWGWCLIPFDLTSVILDYNLSLFFFFVISSLGFYGVLFAGWSSNSKYALFSAFRTLAQLISYEIFIGLTILPLLLMSGSLNLINLVYTQKTVWNSTLFFYLFIVFFIASLAETNRTPFDLPEAEAEIVAGYNIEYSGFIFALFFLGEYSNMILNAAIIALIFLGGWLPVALPFYNFFNPFSFVLKILVLCFFWIFVRACLPRYRYDQLLMLGWGVYLPITLAFFFFFICYSSSTSGLPYIVQLPNLDTYFFQTCSYTSI